jgi:sulfite oxidase
MQQPVNSAPALDQLCRNFITPDANFFTRNHGPVPDLDAATFRLHIGGLVPQPLDLSLDQLREEFPAHTLTATMACAGNRRYALDAIERITDDIIWGNTAIGNAHWTGVRLRAVLERAGITPTNGLHVAFEGLDQIARDGETIHFGASVELDYVFNQDVLLAYAMNGEALSPARGYPLRVLVPGYIGARSVKWVQRVVVQAAPSDNFYQQQSYKLFPPHVTRETVNWAEGQTITEQPLNAVIATPTEHAVIAGRDVAVRGFAVPQGTHTLTRVEVSADGGASWQAATLTTPPQPHVWCFWEATLTLPPGAHQLAVRAFDTSGSVQPVDPAALWNFKGYANNAWHRVNIRVEG